MRRLLAVVSRTITVVVAAVVVSGLMVASAPPAQAETPFDLSAAINACPVGGTVTVPAGTFTVTSTLTPKSGITIQGSGADTVIYRPDPHSGDPTIITIMDKSNITIKNLTLASNDSGVTSTMRGMELGGATNITIDGVTLRGLSNGIVASDNGDKDNSNLTITRCSSVDVYQPMFIRTTHTTARLATLTSMLWRTGRRRSLGPRRTTSTYATTVTT